MYVSGPATTREPSRWASAEASRSAASDSAAASTIISASKA
jgi:hypothetical protein